MSNPILPSGTIDRREAIRRVTALLGGTALVGGSALLDACTRDALVRQQGSVATGAFSSADVSLLDEVAETILPATRTPGAKAAGVGPFMAMMVTDSYDTQDTAIFMAGLKTLDAASQAANHASFVAATPEQRLALLETFDREQKAYMDAKAKDDRAHWFRMIKELSLLGYFTSEIGCTQAMRYIERPGRFDPCVPYAPGDRAWTGSP